MKPQTKNVVFQFITNAHAPEQTHAGKEIALYLVFKVTNSHLTASPIEYNFKNLNRFVQNSLN